MYISAQLYRFWQEIKYSSKVIQTSICKSVEQTRSKGMKISGEQCSEVQKAENKVTCQN